MSGNVSSSNIAFRVSLCGIITALGVCIMLLGTMLGVMTYAAPLFASVFLIPIIYELGNTRAMLVYAATSILAVLLCAEKELAFFYVFIGYYPVIRPFFFKIKSRPIRIAAKLALFAAALVLLYALLCFVLKLDQIIDELKTASILFNVAMFAVLLLTLLVYDAALMAAEKIYVRKIRPRLRFLNKN